MFYIISDEDKLLSQQNDLNYKIRISVLSPSKNIIGTLTGISEIGSFNIDSNSDIRRTTNVVVKLDDFYTDVEQKIETYLNLDFKFEVGILNARTNEYKYYQMGTFCMTNTNTSYDATTNSLSLDLSDGFAKLDGTRNGQIGGTPIIVIPVEYNGKQNTLKTAMIEVIKSETNIKDYIIEDIGEYYGMSQNNSNYLEYRKLNPKWNVIPYDLEYGAGDTVSTLLTTIRDLYPNCQVYYDIYNNFCYDMIPSNDNSPIFLENDYLQSILVASGTENVTYDISSIKNVIEVFGQIYEVNRMSENVSFNSDTYNLTLDSYGSYSSYELIAFKSPSNNTSKSYININSIGKIPLYKEYTTTFIEKDIISKNDMTVIKIMKNTDGNYYSYYLGQYQPHALCVLTEDVNDVVYTKKYFAERYNCLEKNICFIEAKGSAFSVQKLGTLFDSKNGGEYDNIISDSVAIDNAKYCVYKSSVWNDTVTITTKLIPWLDVNIKVEYKKKQEDDIYQYLIKKVTHDFNTGTSNITMCRFSSLYQE